MLTGAIVGAVIAILGIMFRYANKAGHEAERLKTLEAEREAVRLGKAVDYEVDQLSDEEVEERLKKKWSK